MPYSDKAILVDVNGKPIPQIWDEAGDQFVPYEGNVTLSGSNVPAKLAPAGKYNKGFSRTGSLAANTSETILDFVGQCELESLVLSQNAPFQIKCRLQTRNDVGGYTEYQVPRADGSAWDLISLSPSLLNDHNGHNDFFENFKYDTVNSIFSYGMRRQMRAHGGIKVIVSNTDGTNPHNCAAFGDIAIYES